MVCLLICSGGSLVADVYAAGITYLNPTTWDLSDTVGGKVELLDNGNYRITSTKPSITAYFADLEPGASYDFVFRFHTYNVTSPGTCSIGIIDSNQEILTIFEAFNVFNNTGSTKTASFKVPDNFVSPRLVVIFINCSQFIFYPGSCKLVDQSTDKGILNSIKEGFAKLWEWLKGIWDSIKEIPSKIAASLTSLGDRIRDFFNGLGDRISGFFNDIWEKIKAFFLPSDGYFDDYSAEFNVFIDDHFGFLAQLPDELSLIVNTLITYEPSEPPFIDFPEVKLPLPGKTYTIVKQQRYTFDFLSDQPFSTLYTAYQGFVWLAYCLMLFNFLKHKYNVIFGGDGSAG